ncbi:MAG: hypothetical protein QM687_11990 [Ferruginibacter sp.]
MAGTIDIKRILTSQFETDLFEASLASLNEKANKLRYNNFAYSIRELSRHFLHRLAPELNIKNCSWFKNETTDGKPTRLQRIKYAIQGGITDELLEQWGFEIEELTETIKEIKTTIDSLSKYTHINPEVFDLNEDDVIKYSEEVLSSFKTFVLTIENYREQLKTFLDGHIEEHMVSSVVSNFFENVDRLAPHHSLDYSEISDYHVSEINDQEIVVDVFGNLHVTLEYGSRQERREGDGLDLKESFPFETKIRYEINEDFPSEKYQVDDYDVDTSEWYGDEDNIDGEIDRHTKNTE